jgi:hypothetical protein
MQEFKLITRREYSVDTGESEKRRIETRVEWGFRHERIRDYFLAMALAENEKGVKKLAAENDRDPRYSGVFDFLPFLQSDEAFAVTSEFLKSRAADTGRNEIWLKYKNAAAQAKRTLPRKKKHNRDKATQAELPKSTPEA